VLGTPFAAMYPFLRDHLVAILGFAFSSSSDLNSIDFDVLGQYQISLLWLEKQVPPVWLITVFWECQSSGFLAF